MYFMMLLSKWASIQKLPPVRLLKMVMKTRGEMEFKRVKGHGFQENDGRFLSRWVVRWRKIG